MIQFINTEKEFKTKAHTVKALHAVNLTVNQGDIFGVIGYSGAGKSTLIRTVNLLETPTSGSVIVDNKDLTTLSKRQLREEKKKIGMIFQHFNLLSSRTVFDNVAIPLELSGLPKKEIVQRVNEALAFVGLENKATSYIEQLSGGQKQRVGIARALVTQPTILLCDEATSALDPQTTKSILALLKRVNEQFNITILIITHEMEVIKEICNRVAVMEAGHIIETGSVIDVFAAPKHETTKKFVNSIVRDEVPPSVLNQLSSSNVNRYIYKLSFLGTGVGQPIVSQVAKKFAVDVNILFGNIIELQGVPLGNLLVEFEGTVSEIEKAINYMQLKNINIKEVLTVENQSRDLSERDLGNPVYG